MGRSKAAFFRAPYATVMPMTNPLANATKVITGIILGLTIGSYVPTAMHIASREVYYATTGTVPNMAPQIAFYFSFILGALVFIVVCFFELVRTYAYEGKALTFFEALILGLLSSSVVWLLFVGHVSGWIYFVALCVFSLFLFYLGRLFISRIRHNKSLKTGTPQSGAP